MPIVIRLDHNSGSRGKIIESDDLRYPVGKLFEYRVKVLRSSSTGPRHSINVASNSTTWHDVGDVFTLTCTRTSGSDEPLPVFQPGSSFSVTLGNGPAADRPVYEREKVPFDSNPLEYIHITLETLDDGTLALASTNLSGHYPGVIADVTSENAEGIVFVSFQGQDFASRFQQRMGRFVRYTVITK